MVTVLMLLGYASQPLHHLDPAWVSVAAVGVLAAGGLVTLEPLRAVNWNYVLLFGVLASMTDVFAATGLDQSLMSLPAPPMGTLAGNPFAFVVLLTLGCFVASLVVRFPAAAPLVTIAVAPIGQGIGIDPWVVAIVAQVRTCGFFLPHQSSFYLALHQATGGNLFDHRQARPAALTYGPVFRSERDAGGL